MLKKFIRWYIKRIPREQRAFRIHFVGKRLKYLQDHWLERDNSRTDLKRPE